MIGDAMGDITKASYSLLSPELYLLGWTLFLLVYGVYRIRKTDIFCIGAALLVLGITVWLDTSLVTRRAIVMNGFFISDPFAVLTKGLIIIASMLTIFLSSAWLREEGGRPFEYLILVMLSTVGMMCMVSANDLLALYMALELSSL